MSKSIKFRNNIFLDSRSITHNRRNLFDLIEVKNLNLSLISQPYYTINYSQYTQGSQVLDHVTYICFFLHVNSRPGYDEKIFEVPAPISSPHWQFKCWETAVDNETPLVIHINPDGSMYARNGVAGMNYFVQLFYINQ